jgi:rod shape determining protein RodA
MRLPGSIRSYRGRLDPFLILPAGALILLGCLAVYSATEFPDSARAGFFTRHLLAFPAAIFVLLFAMALPLRFLEDLAYVLSGGTLLLLIGVLVAGTEVYGARRWLGVGPIRMQPSELAKVTTALVVARFFASKRRDPAKFGDLLSLLGLIFLPMVLVLKQPDLGTAGAFPALGLAVLLWAGLPLLHL